MCSVFDGKERHQVICGAPNVRKGLVTAYAKVGAVLPDNFKIKKAKLRGVESQGMLLAASKGDTLKLVTVEGDIGPGASVK